MRKNVGLAGKTRGHRRCELIGIGRFPSLHHRKEGWPSDQKMIAKPPMRAKGKPPRLRQLRWLREILLMTQPPLLAVVQGGECAGSEISALRVGTYTANSSVTAPWGRNFHRTWTIKPACRLKSLLRTP